jgi:3-oxoadipate CoA-transferase beta subunit
MAARLARDIPEGWYVNLGLGLPTLIPDHIPSGREVVFHSENGVLGMGPVPPKDKVDTWLVNATKQNITLVPGASAVSPRRQFRDDPWRDISTCACSAPTKSPRTATSPIGRPTRTTQCPRSAARWTLSAGSKRLWVLMEHTTKDGRARIVRRCSYPLTAAGVVKRIYTNLAVIDVTARGFELVDMAPGLSFESLQASTDAKLHRQTD